MRHLDQYERILYSQQQHVAKNPTTTDMYCPSLSLSLVRNPCKMKIRDKETHPQIRTEQPRNKRRVEIKSRKTATRSSKHRRHTSPQAKTNQPKPPFLSRIIAPTMPLKLHLPSSKAGSSPTHEWRKALISNNQRRITITGTTTSSSFHVIEPSNHCSQTSQSELSLLPRATDFRPNPQPNRQPAKPRTTNTRETTKPNPAKPSRPPMTAADPSPTMARARGIVISRLP